LETTASLVLPRRSAIALPVTPAAQSCVSSAMRASVQKPRPPALPLVLGLRRLIGGSSGRSYGRVACSCSVLLPTGWAWRCDYVNTLARHVGHTPSQPGLASAPAGALASLRKSQAPGSPHHGG